MLPKPQNRRVGRRAPVASEGFPRRAPTRPQPPWFSASRARAAPAAVIFRARRFAASQSARAPRHQTRAGQFGSFPASRTHASTAAMVFRAPRFAASQSAGAPRRRTRAGRFGGFPTPCAHASTAAVVFRVTRPRGTSRRDLPRPALRRVPIRESAASPDARRSVRKFSRVAYPRVHSRYGFPRPRFAASQSARAPRRQMRAGQFRRFPTPCAHASTAAVVSRVTRPRGTSRRDLPRPALRRVPIRGSAAPPDARRSVRRVYHAARLCGHSRRVLPHPAPRRQTRAGQFGRFPTPCAHAATTAAFFRTPRRVGRRAPVASEGFPRRAPTRSQPLWVSAPALRRVPIRESAASADARRSVQKVSHAVRPRVHSRRGFPRHAPARNQPP